MELELSKFRIHEKEIGSAQTTLGERVTEEVMRIGEDGRIQIRYPGFWGTGKWSLNFQSFASERKKMNQHKPHSENESQSKEERKRRNMDRGSNEDRRRREDPDSVSRFWKTEKCNLNFQNFEPSERNRISTNNTRGTSRKARRSEASIDTSG